MELFTQELEKYKKLSEKWTQKCELIQTEVNLMNKLLFFEQKFSDHLLNEVFVCYENNFKDFKQNYRYFEDWKRLEIQKTISKENENQVKRLRRELKTWRQFNGRLDNEIQKTDHTYSTGTDPITKLKDNSMQTLSPITNHRSVCQPKASPKPNISAEVLPEMVSIKMEVIPKEEPEELCEDTDSSSEADFYIEGVEPLPASPPQTSKPFQFATEYLSKNKAFSHLIDKSKDESQPSTDDKSVAIDLNTDSDNETTAGPSNEQPVTCVQEVDSIFDDNIVDLTPKVATPKKTFIRRKSRFGKNRKTVKNKQKPVEQPLVITTRASNTTNSNENKIRIIGSKRKKIHFNADNTISIIEVTESPNKKSKSYDKLSSTQTNINSNPLKGRTEKSKINEKLVKSTKKIVFKDKLYYCRWSQCSYSTHMRANAIRHLWKHTGETPFKCQLCPKGFRDKRNLAKHVMTHNAFGSNSSADNRSTETGYVVCPECDHKFEYFQLLFNHIKTIHGLEKAKNYRKKYYRQRNLLKQKTPEVDKQNKLRSNQNQIEKSPKKGDKSRLRLISQKKVENKFENSPQKTKQSIENSIQSRSEWKCDFSSCTRSYSGKHNLKRHQMEIHKKLSKPLFYSLSKNTDKIYKYFIPKTTQSVENSVKVKKVVNIQETTVPQNPKTGTKKFVCNYRKCQNSYNTIIGLYNHKKKVHNSKVIWDSMVKKAKRYQSITVAQHISTDNSINNSVNISPVKSCVRNYVGNYLCDECGSRFVWPKNLKTHMRVKHNISKPIIEPTVEEESKQIPCPYKDCPTVSVSQKSLVIHYRTHFSSEDKPFKCLISGCNYSAKKLSQLKYHVLNRHSEQQFFKAMEESGVHYPIWY